MMKRRPFAGPVSLIVLTMALSACQKEADKPAVENVTIGNVVEDTTPAEAAKAGVPPTASNAVPAADPEKVLSGIPMAFRGRWGMVEADCDVSRSDTKGLVTVDAESLKFYESMGRLKTIDVVSPIEVKANFAFSGEGQSWTKTMTLKLDEGGTTLVRVEQDPSGTFRHKKCA